MYEYIPVKFICSYAYAQMPHVADPSRKEEFEALTLFEKNAF